MEIWIVEERYWAPHETGPWRPVSMHREQAQAIETERQAWDGATMARIRRYVPADELPTPPKTGGEL